MIKVGYNKIKKLLAFVLFLTLTFYIFVNLTYLMRNSDEGRLSFLTFAEEPAESLDVVYIGGSNVYVFWDPMCAWNQYGFTSYNYSTSNMPATTFLPLVKEINESKKPKLIIVGLRTFLSSVYETLASGGVINGGGYRNVVDSQNISFDRAKLISYTCAMNPDSFADSLESYLDLIYYHTNLPSLSNPRNWFLSNNTTGNNFGKVTSDYYFKGYMANSWLTAKVTLFKDFLPPRTEETLPLYPESEKCYRDLLSYCADHDIPLLITANPNISMESLEKQVNYCQNIAAEYGIPFLNLNTPERWEEMGLSAESDFYNTNHVNVNGAEKFTTYFAEYLSKHYELPDHRNDPDFDSWNKLYNEKYLPHIEPLREQAKNMADSFQITIANEKKMRQTKNTVDWFFYADDPNITLLMAANMPDQTTPSNEAWLILDKFGISPLFKEEATQYIGVYSGSIKLSNTTITTFEGDTVTFDHSSSFHSVHYSIQLDPLISITVGEDSYAFDDEKGLYIIAIDNNLLSVVDCVSVNVNSKGNLTLTHTEGSLGIETKNKST